MSYSADLDKALEELREISILGDGWDSYGAPPISRTSIDMAAVLIIGLFSDGLPLPWVVPSSSGGVGLEWQGNEYEVVLDIRPSGTVETAWVFHGPNDTEVDFRSEEFTRAITMTAKVGE